MQGNLEHAERLYTERRSEIDRRLGKLEGQANNLGSLGNVAVLRGDLDAAEKLYRESLDIEANLGGLAGQATTLSNLGNIAKQRGDSDAARQLWSESRDLYERSGFRAR